VRVVTLHEGHSRSSDIINDVEIVYLPLMNIYWPFDNKVRSKIAKFIWHSIDCYNLLAKKKVGEEIDLYSPDLVHTNNLAGFSVAAWSAAAARNIKIIHTSRDYYLFHPNATLYKNGQNQDLKSFSVLAWSFIKKRNSHKVSTFVGISKFIKNLHEDNGFFPKSISVFIYNPVTQPPLQHIFGEEVRLGFIGRLSVAKGFPHYCRIVDEIKGRKPRVTAVAAGDFLEEERDKLEILANTAGVALLGKIALAEFLTQVDVVILPAQWKEPFGRTVIEAALANKIVFVYPSGGIGELMELVPNVFEIDGDFYHAFLSDEEITQVALPSNIREMFSPQIITEEYIAEYDRIKK